MSPRAATSTAIGAVSVLAAMHSVAVYHRPHGKLLHLIGFVLLGIAAWAVSCVRRATLHTRGDPASRSE